VTADKKISVKLLFLLTGEQIFEAKKPAKLGGGKIATYCF